MNELATLHGMSDNLVAKSNHLIRASYRLTLVEQRILLTAMSMVDSRKGRGQPLDKTIRITADDYLSTFPDTNPAAVYRDLRSAGKRIMKRVITTHDGRYECDFHWTDTAKYCEGDGWIEITFSTHIQPYITQLKNNFTRYKLKQIAEFNSIYSIRLFEFFEQHKDKGECFITIKDFKSYLDLDGKYKRFVDLKRRVINPALSELESKSNMIIKWKTTRKKRKLHGLEFRFAQNPQGKLL